MRLKIAERGPMTESVSLKKHIYSRCCLSERLSTHLNFSPVEEGRRKSEGEERGKAASNHPTCRATQLSEREEQVAKI